MPESQPDKNGWYRPESPPSEPGYYIVCFKLNGDTRFHYDAYWSGSSWSVDVSERVIGVPAILAWCHRVDLQIPEWLT